LGLAFFRDEVPDERKLVMFNALQKPTRKQAVKGLEAKRHSGEYWEHGAGQL